LGFEGKISRFWYKISGLEVPFFGFEDKILGTGGMSFGIGGMTLETWQNI
jgi:hypothetical protein